MSFEFEIEGDEEPEPSSTVTMAQLIATNKIMTMLIDELTERHETSRKLLVSSIKFLHPDHPTRTLLAAIVRLLDRDIETYLWDMGKEE